MACHHAADDTGCVQSRQAKQLQTDAYIADLLRAVYIIRQQLLPELSSPHVLLRLIIQQQSCQGTAQQC